MAAHRRGLPRGVRAIRIALDTTPLRQTRAGTARYVRGLRDHLSTDVVEVSYPATSRARTLAADVAWYPRLRAPAGADVLHCPTFRGPFRARGPLVVTEDLVDALESGYIAGAGVDVTEPEPLPVDSRLWEQPNAIITPHVGGQSATRADDMTNFFCENLRRYFAGEKLINLVDKRLGFPFVDLTPLPLSR